jgi:hypothetical protein
VTRLHRVAAAALAGLLATVGLLFSPVLGGLPPIVPPYVPVDLRWLVLPVAFVALQLVAEHLVWPAPATSVLGAALLAALGANVHTSQVLAYLGVPWARSGASVDLLGLATSLGALAVGLGTAFDAAHERFRGQLVDRGVEERRLAPVTVLAQAQARRAIAAAVLAVAGLGLLVRLVGQVLGGTAVPLPELAAIALALVAGALLVGLPRDRAA